MTLNLNVNNYELLINFAATLVLLNLFYYFEAML